MKDNNIVPDKISERVEGFLLHEYSLMTNQLQHNIDTSDSRMKFFITLISSGLAGMAFLTQFLTNTSYISYFIVGVCGVFWVAGFYFNTTELNSFIIRLEIYYKIFKIKTYFERYEPLIDYVVSEKENSWLFKGYKNKKSISTPAPDNTFLYILISSLFFSTMVYFIGTTMFTNYFSFEIALVVFMIHLIYLILKSFFKVTGSEANKNLSNLMNELHVLVK